MMTYFTLSDEIVRDRSLSIKRSNEIIRILLAFLLLFCTVFGRRITMPLEEAVAENVVISEEMAEVEIGMPVSDGTKESVLSAEFLECGIPVNSLSLKLDPVCFTDYVKAEMPLTPSSSEGETVSVPEETPAIPAAVSENLENQHEATVSSVTINGFICDASGRITGCDGVSVIDGVLLLPSDKGCTGIVAGALASLGEEVEEIYIPANITDIDEGAFDGLACLMYIEVHPDNPAYGSSGGVLYMK